MSYQSFISEALSNYKQSQATDRNDAFQLGLQTYYPNSQFAQAGWQPPTSPYLSALLEYLQSSGQSFGTEKQPGMGWAQPMQGYGRGGYWTPPYTRGGRY